jgi:putative sigma-54 modulation protein
MNVEITGRRVVITPAIRTYVMKRLRKFTRVLPEPLNFHVILAVQKDRHVAEVLLKTKLLDLTATGETGDMYSAVTRALDHIERQALRQKNKLIETKRKRGKAKSLAEKSGVGTGAPGGLAARRRPNGIQEEDAQRKPMDVEEAVLELGQSEYPFVVFRNAESGAVNVLYRRKDGSLGLIHA